MTMTTAWEQKSDLALIDAVAMQVIDSVSHLAEAVAADLRRHVPELDHVDPEAPAALRRGVEQSHVELCSLLRSGFPVARTPPVGGLENAIALSESGLGWSAAEESVRLSTLLFRRVVGAFARAAAPGDEALGVVVGEVDALLSEYWVEQALVLSDVYHGGRGHEPKPLTPDEPVPDPPGAPATDAFISEALPSSGGPVDSLLVARVRARNEAIVEEFCEALETAAEDPRMAAKLASADTSVAIVVADGDDACATFLLDREPIEIARGATVPGEAEIRIAAADLDRLRTEEFHLAMAMARGRVEWRGPVRKFLRVAPVIRAIVAGSTGGGERIAGQP
jgi:hypothetical protein